MQIINIAAEEGGGGNGFIHFTSSFTTRPLLRKLADYHSLSKQSKEE
jgi:hypothetical protein